MPGPRGVSLPSGDIGKSPSLIALGEGPTAYGAACVPPQHQRKLVLNLQVIRGKEFASMDINGSSDPYCKLKYGEKTFQTRIIMENLNPEWDEDFDMIVEDIFSPLHLEVMQTGFVVKVFFGQCCAHDVSRLIQQIENGAYAIFSEALHTQHKTWAMKIIAGVGP